MAKKLGKFLLGMAALGGAAAAAYSYLQIIDAVTLTSEYDDEDYDDFSEELDETSSRNYVQLNKEAVAETIEEAADAVEDAVSEVAEKVEETVEEAVEEAAEAVEEIVEEFFNEDEQVSE